MVLYEIYKEDGGNGITFVHMLYVIGLHKSNDVLFHKMLSSSNQCNQSIIIVLNSLLIVLPEIKNICIVLYCIVLYCIVLYCIVLYCIVLYCIVLYCIVVFQRLNERDKFV